MLAPPLNLAGENPFQVYANNLNSTLIALNIARSTKANFVFMSSYVYGPPQYLPIDEAHPLSAVNPYMGSKIAGELICQQISKIYQIPLIILRSFNIYGHFITPGRLISDLVEAAQHNNRLVLNDGTPKRDYLYIKDFHTLILRILSKETPNNGIFNVGYGKSYTNLEVAEIISQIGGYNSKILVKSQPRPNDINDCSVNVDLVKSQISHGITLLTKTRVNEIFTTL